MKISGYSNTKAAHEMLLCYCAHSCILSCSQEELDKFRNEMARRQPTDKEDDSKAGEANDLKELTDGSEEGVVVERKEMEFDVDDTVPTVTNGNVKLEQTQELLVGEGR